jgi:protein O-GlcNAc transferase
MFANSANVALTAGDPNAALELATQAIAINPEFWVGYLHLGGAHLALGNLDDALQAYATAEKLSGGNSKVALASRAYILTRLGRVDEARDILAQLVSQAETEYVAPYHFAVIHASLGEIDAAIQWLEIACAAENAMFDIDSDQRLDALRSDLRFERLLQNCGFGRAQRDTVETPGSLH